MKQNENTLGVSLSKVFEAERRLVDELTVTNLELPWCKDVAVGKTVKLKYHYGPKWWVVGEGKWTEYSRTKQVIEKSKPIGQGGVDFSWELVGDTLSYSINGSYRDRAINDHGSLTVSAYEHCDESDNGRRNNKTGLRGSTERGDKFDSWPKNRDRARLVITESGGREHEIEIDTDE